MRSKGNERRFFRVAQAFQMPFAAQRLVTVLEGFLIDQLHRQAGAGVFRARAAVVGLQPGVQIHGPAAVQRSVPTTE